SRQSISHAPRSNSYSGGPLSPLQVALQLAIVVDMHNLVVGNARDRIPDLVVAGAMDHQHPTLGRELVFACGNDEAQPLLGLAPRCVGDQLDAPFVLHTGIGAAAGAVNAAPLVGAAGHAGAA